MATYYGGNGNDTYTGRNGADSISGGGGNDTLDGAGGNDTINGGTGDDSLIGGSGNDRLDGGDGNDTLAGGTGADVLAGGQGLDIVDYSSSASAVNVNLTANTASGGDAQGDTFSGIDGITGSAHNDQLTGFDNQGTSGSDIYTNVIHGGGGNDTIDGRGGDDSLYGDEGEDRVIGGAGNDLVEGGAGNDSLQGDDGDDSLSGDEGNDTLSGGAGNDLVEGGDGNDSLRGDDGNDTLSGGAGNDGLDGGAGDDRLDGGDGNNTLTGGLGNDTIFAGIGDVIIGGEDDDGDDRDVLLLNIDPSWPYTIVRDEDDPESGWIHVETPDGPRSIRFENIERIRSVPCFTPGTRILTLRGELPVEALKPGDMVLTRDSGYRPVRWVGSRRLAPDLLALVPELRPILIRRGALGPDRPARDMMVSRQHRMLLWGARAELLFGEGEVLVRALHLLALPGVEEAAVAEVTYIHMLFDRHEIVMADGAWTESFQPGDRTLEGLDDDQRAELFAIFPELRCEGGGDSFAAARPTLRAHEVRALLAA